MTQPLLVVHVVIPARNEERLLAGTLRSIDKAFAQTRASFPRVVVSCIVVLDQCEDRSEWCVREAGHQLITVDYGCVGAARHAGASNALAISLAMGVPPRRSWIACTDADSVVPEHWLIDHIEHSATVDAVFGTVQPGGSIDSEMLRRWHSRHELREGHPHIHGANLGIRGSTYLDVGGFRALSTGEDVDLAERLRAHTSRWVATDRARVVTSDRRRGRARGGFADYLGTLDIEGSGQLIGSVR